MRGGADSPAVSPTSSLKPIPHPNPNLPTGLYLDAKTKQYVEEFSTSNFVGIDAKGAFVTPDSPTILPSITKKVREHHAP